MDSEVPDPCEWIISLMLAGLFMLLGAILLEILT